VQADLALNGVSIVGIKRDETRTTRRLAVAFEAGRDGFWLARWLTRYGIEAHVIYPTSVAVSREHKRAKTDRLDTAMLTRVFLGWLRGETRSLWNGRRPNDRGRG
jgi:transposase